MEALLKQLVDSQNRYCNMLALHLDRAERLLEISEGRIDRTNDMIIRLAENTNKQEHMLMKITDEYTKHLHSLSSCRDELTKQNTLLLQMVQMLANKTTLNQTFNDANQ